MRRATPSFAALAVVLALAAVAASCNSSSGNRGGGPASSQLAILAPPGSTVSEVCLRVDSYTLQAGAVGNTNPIVMWGYVPTGSGAGCGFAGPGPDGTRAVIPTIEAAEGSYLFVHLQNNLAGGPSALIEPVSVIAPGQTFFGSDAPGSPGPTWTDGSTGPRNPAANPPQRVRSFTVEAPPGSGAPGPVVTYSFGPLRAGTYLLQSGTHPGIQVQMGLSATLIVRPATAGRAYPDPSTVFNAELTLHFSEIDPALHAAVASGHYGPAPDPAPADWVTSPIDHHPQFFLVNGSPYLAGAPSLATVQGNTRLLLRFLNAGMDTRVPVAGGRYLSLVAEDGNFYTATSSQGSCPAPRRQYSVLLPAGKTIDGILETPASGNRLAVYDRRGNVTSAGVWPGGLLATLTIQGGGTTPPGPAVAPCGLTGP